LISLFDIVISYFYILICAITIVMAIAVAIAGIQWSSIEQHRIRTAE